MLILYHKCTIRYLLNSPLCFSELELRGFFDDNSGISFRVRSNSSCRDPSLELPVLMRSHNIIMFLFRINKIIPVLLSHL